MRPRRSRLVRNALAAALLGPLLATTAVSPAEGAPATKSVGWGGVRVNVPANWPVIDVDGRPGCVRYDQNAVYLGEPSVSTCPARTVGRAGAVHLGRSLERPATGTSGGTTDTALRFANGTTVYVAAAPDASQARAIVASAASASRRTHRLTPDTLDAEAAGKLADLTTTSTTTTTTTTSTPSTLKPGTFTGAGFDACSAPSIAQLKAWLASDYRAVNIYIGGIARGCAQPNLTSTWVSQAAAMGWRLIPTYVGRQAPCTRFTNRIDPTAAATQGSASADDAVTLMAGLGLGAANPVYLDIEHYDVTDAACVAAVREFTDAWTRRLRSRGYLSGIYGGSRSMMANLASWVGTSYAVPNDIWFAAWDGRNTTLGDPYIPDALWPRQRIHQYRGDHDETWGGVTLNIDSNAVDAHIAPATYTLTGTPTPTIAGTAVVGNTLTALAGSWSPAPVTLLYAWRRTVNGVTTLISGANAATYVPTVADVGAALSVVVTGSKPGYAAVSRASASTEPVPTPYTVTAPAPTRSDACGTASDTYTIPARTGVTYRVAGVVTSAGTYAGGGAASVLVTAEPKPGYQVSGTTSWTLTFTTGCTA